jgi:cytochrome b involved in lipid metabolism
MKKFTTICIVLFCLIYGVILAGGAISHVPASLEYEAATSAAVTVKSGSTATTGTSTTQSNTSSTSQNTGTTATTYSVTDVATHSSSTNCWMIVSTKVYDVSAYISTGSHRAGNSAITPYCGKDATSVFGVHNSSGYSVLSGYYIGTLK